MFCINCGNRLANENVFCPFCGTRVRAQTDNPNADNLSAQPVSPVTEGKKDKGIIQKLGLALVIGCVVVFISVFFRHSESSTPNQVVKSQAHNEPARRVTPSMTAPLEVGDSALTVGADALLAAYQQDERGAESKYKHRRLTVTGTLTGVFVPTAEQALEMAQKDFTATALVTMGGPRISSPAEVLLLPGISAYSNKASFFGEQEYIPLRVDQVVTLACKCDGGSPAMAKVAGTGPTYKVLLSDCTLEAPNPIASQTNQEPRFAGQEPLSNIVETEQRSEHPNAASSSTWSLKFEAYKVGQVYRGQPAPVRIVTANQRMFRTRIRDGSKEGPNFAGHFTVISWGCGLGCLDVEVVDAISGQAYDDAPFSGLVFLTGAQSGREYQGLVYQPDSRLLIADGCQDKCGTSYYEWREDGLKLLLFEREASQN
jgi:hypothetical protein